MVLHHVGLRLNSLVEKLCLVEVVIVMWWMYVVRKELRTYSNVMPCLVRKWIIIVNIVNIMNVVKVGKTEKLEVLGLASGHVRKQVRRVDQTLYPIQSGSFVGLGPWLYAKSPCFGRKWNATVQNCVSKNELQTFWFRNRTAKVQIPVYLGVYTHTPPAGGRLAKVLATLV